MPEPSGPEPTRSLKQDVGAAPEPRVQRPHRLGSPKLWEAATPVSSSNQPTLKIERHPVSTGPAPAFLPRRVFTLEEQSKFTESDYIIERLIGEGGMGWVYSAKQRCLNRKVAIKAIHADDAQVDSTRKQFLAEALFTGELDHPNIVPVHELGTNEEGQLFYAMKQVHGTPWSAVLAEKSLGENLGILLRVADAIAFAHARSIIHCDLKPDNIMLGGFGEVYVMDWGLALSTQAPSSTSGSPDFFPGGTPAYMPPEFARGQREKIGPASDLYLLGAILYEILTGTAPHAGATLSGPTATYTDAVQRPARDHAGLSDIAMRALSIEPGNRQKDVKEFQQELRACREHMDSLLLTESGDHFLNEARRTGTYQSFTRALHAYEQSVQLWSENNEARDSAEVTRLEFAHRALEHADLDLADSLLDPGNSRHQPLIKQISQRRKERDHRQASLRRMKTVLILLVLLTIGILLVGQSWIRSQRNSARYESTINATRLAVQELFLGNWTEVQALREHLPIPPNGWEWEWMEKNSHPAFSGPGRAVNSPRLARVSPDGRINAWLDLKGQIQFWAGDKTWSWPAGSGVRDFRLLTDAQGSLTVVLWNVAGISFLEGDKGQFMEFCPLAGTAGESGCLSANGQRLLRIDPDKSIQIFDSKTARPLVQLALPGQSQILRADLSPDGNRAAVLFDRNLVMTFDTRTGKILRQASLYPGRIPLSQIEFIQGGKALLVGNFERGLAVVDSSTLTPRLSLPLPAIPSAFAVSPDGRYLAAATEEGDILMQDLTLGNIVWRTRLPGQSIAFLDFRKDPVRLQIITRAALLLELPLEDRLPYRVLARYDYPALTLAQDPSSGDLFGARQNGTLSRINLLGNSASNKNSTQGLNPKFSISAAGSGKTFRLFLSKTEGIEVWGIEGKISPGKTFPSANHLALSPSGKFLAVARKNVLFLYRTENSAELGHWEFNSDLSALEWADDDSFLAFGCNNGYLSVLHRTSGKFLFQAELQEPVLALAVSPNRHDLAVANQNRSVSIHDLKTGQVKHELRSHDHIVLDLAYSPRQDRLFTASADGRIHLFDTQTWREMVSFQAHRGAVIQLLLAAKGSTLITTGADGEVRLWAGTQTPEAWLKSSAQEK